MLSSDALQVFVERSYYIGRVKNCKLLARGLNDTYRVDSDKGKFILRVYRTPWRSKTDIYYETDVLNYLSENGVTVSAPIKSNEGSFAIEIYAPEGNRYLTLYTYAKGSIPNLNEEVSYQYGKLVASIHKLTDSFTSSYQRFHLDLNYLLEEPLNIIRLQMIEYGGDISYLESWSRTIRKRFAVETMDFGFCHGDIHDWNAHWEDGILTLFDFDCCGNGFRAYDLAVFLWSLKINYKDKEANNWMSFLKGYTATRNLNEIDLNSIPLFVAARRIWLAGVYVGNEDVWGTAFINEKFFNDLVNQLRKDEQQLGLSIM